MKSNLILSFDVSFEEVWFNDQKNSSQTLILKFGNTNEN